MFFCGLDATISSNYQWGGPPPATFAAKIKARAIEKKKEIAEEEAAEAAEADARADRVPPHTPLLSHTHVDRMEDGGQGFMGTKISSRRRGGTPDHPPPYPKWGEGGPNIPYHAIPYPPPSLAPKFWEDPVLDPKKIGMEDGGSSEVVPRIFWGCGSIFDSGIFGVVLALG